MKTKQIKQELFFYYQAPKPDRKQEFLQHFSEPGMTSWQFMRGQAGYIKKWIWGISILLLLLLLSCCSFFHKDMLNVMASFAPFIAMSLLAEGSRSYVYGMEELELATRFSLKSVLLARMGILAVFHLFLLLVMVLFSVGSGAGQYCLAGIRILLPYFTSISIGLPLIRRFHGRESGYLCVAIAVIVSILSWYLQEILVWRGEVQLLPIFGMLLILEIIFGAVESTKLLKQSEELV